MSGVGKIRYPFGPVTHLQPAYAANIEAHIDNSKTILEPAILTGNLALDLTIESDLPAGAELVVVIKATANGQNMTPGNGMIGPVIVGVTGKTKSVIYTYDGINFRASGADAQID